MFQFTNSPNSANYFAIFDQIVGELQNSRDCDKMNYEAANVIKNHSPHLPGFSSLSLDIIVFSYLPFSVLMNSDSN